MARNPFSDNLRDHPKLPNGKILCVGCNNAVAPKNWARHRKSEMHATRGGTLRAPEAPPTSADATAPRDTQADATDKGRRKRLGLKPPTVSPPLEGDLLKYMFEEGKGGTNHDSNNRQKTTRIFKMMRIAADDKDSPEAYTPQALYHILTHRSIVAKIRSKILETGAKAAETWMASLRVGCKYLLRASPSTRRMTRRSRPWAAWSGS